MRTLIADSGSTKTDWELLHDGVKVLSFQSKGLNPYVHTSSEIEQVLTEVKEKLTSNLIPDSVFFYGASCSSPSLIRIIQDAFNKVGFQDSELHITHDLLAAAHALFQKDDGIACILGTGSSSALYSNGKIGNHIPSLGYVLDDEGGGAALGKRLLVSIFKKEAPDQIQMAFQQKYNLNVEDVLRNIYFEPSPNRYMASFAMFISENINEAFIRQIVLESFRSFIVLNVMKYEGVHTLPIGFVGSVAFYFKDLMLEVLKENGLIPGPFIKSPMEGLLQYHGNNLP